MFSSYCVVVLKSADGIVCPDMGLSLSIQMHCEPTWMICCFLHRRFCVYSLLCMFTHKQFTFDFLVSLIHYNYIPFISKLRIFLSDFYEECHSFFPHEFDDQKLYLRLKQNIDY